VELTFQRESGSTSFGAKVALSLNGVDPSFMNSVAGSYFEKPSGLNIFMIVVTIQKHFQPSLIFESKEGSTRK
jgi:hypothetical protein